MGVMCVVVIDILYYNSKRKVFELSTDVRLFSVHAPCSVQQ